MQTLLPRSLRIAVLSACLLAGPAVQRAAEGRPPVLVTEISGEGRSEDEAIKVALLAAIRFACGEYLQVREEMMGRRSHEQILSLSNGTIRSFTVTSRSSAGPRVSVTIDCLVERNSPGIIGKLPPEAETVSSRSLWAQLYTRTRTKSEAYALLREMLPRILAESLSARWVSSGDGPGGEALPAALSLAESWRTRRHTVGFPVRIAAEADYWADSAVPLLVRCLEALAEASHDLPVRFERVGAVHPAEFRLCTSAGTNVTAADLLGLDPVRQSRRLGEVVRRALTLDLPAGRGSEESVFRTYVFDAETWGALEELLGRLDQTTVTIALLGPDDAVILSSAERGGGQLFHRLHFRPAGPGRRDTMEVALPGTIYLGPRLSCRRDLLETSGAGAFRLLEFQQGKPEPLTSLEDPETNLVLAKVILFRSALAEDQFEQVHGIKVQVHSGPAPGSSTGRRP